MGIRTVCFVLAVVSIGHWFMWVFIAGSFLLPYVAVILANAGASPDPGGPDYFDPDPGSARSRVVQTRRVDRRVSDTVLDLALRACKNRRAASSVSPV